MTASLFRKRPVVIEAVRFDRPFTRATEFCPDLRIVRRGGRGNAVAFGRIETLEGPMTAQVGDWIIKGVQGEFYACKPDIFEATYEPAQDDGQADG